MARFTNDWFTRHIPNWEGMLEEIKDKPINVLEVGCFEGMATLWLLDNILTNPQSHITVIDTFEGSREHKAGFHKTDFSHTYDLFIENTQEYEDKITVLKGLSQDRLREIKDQYDLIYIDGSHESEDVLTDAILSWLLLKKDGLMIFDDYNWESVAMAADIFLHLWRGKYIMIEVKGELAIKKL